MPDKNHKTSSLKSRLEKIEKVEHTPAVQRLMARILSGLFLLASMYSYSRSGKELDFKDIEIIKAGVFAILGIAFLLARPSLPTDVDQRGSDI